MKKNSTDLPFFPLDDVTIRRVKEPRLVENPVFSNNWMSINANEFRMEVKGVGRFYAAHGNLVEYAAEPDAGNASIELYLNGSVFGAILHQRKTLPIHGSSFIFDHRGIMICGDSGAGKSSITASFCLKGAEFLTDDVTPVIFENHKPQIIPKSDRIKLWENSLRQLSKSSETLTQIRPEDEKYYFKLDHSKRPSFPLHQIVILKLKETGKVEFEPVDKSTAFSALHNEIYRIEYLGVMPEVLQNYLQKIVSVCNHCRVTNVYRPEEITISGMQKILSDFLLSEP